MEKLNYDVIKKVGYDGYLLKEAPEKVMQFGEGNFLRAFVDYWIFKPYHDKDLSSAYIRAMDHPKVRFLGHIDDARFPVDFEYLLEIAKEKHVYPEINNGSLMPDAYRINGQENCRRILSICKKLDLPVLLSSDSHGKKNIGNMQYIFPLLEELDFPAHLVLNSDLSALSDIIR